MIKHTEPDELTLWLHTRDIDSIKVVSEQSGMAGESRTTHIIMKSTGLGERKELLHKVEALCEFDPNWQAVLRLRPHFTAMCEVWEEFQEENKEDLKEFERLKKKLGK